MAGPPGWESSAAAKEVESRPNLLGEPGCARPKSARAKCAIHLRRIVVSLSTNKSDLSFSSDSCSIVVAVLNSFKRVQRAAYDPVPPW
nr:hypothetical protein Hi04_10k_c5016_00038 [uncultured bacterium]